MIDLAWKPRPRWQYRIRREFRSPYESEIDLLVVPPGGEASKDKGRGAIWCADILGTKFGGFGATGSLVPRALTLRKPCRSEGAEIHAGGFTIGDELRHGGATGGRIENAPAIVAGGDVSS